MKKRGYKRGLITRAQKRLATLSAKAMRNVHCSDISKMLTSLNTEITHHDAIQYQILELVVDDPTTHEAEQVEQESRDEFHIELVSQVEHLLGRHDVWVSALVLQAEKDSLASLTDPSKPLFRTGVQAYGKNLDSLN